MNIVISPIVLEWIAKQNQTSIHALAQEFCPDDVGAFTQGKLTLEQVTLLAEKGNIPFGFLFLDEVPVRVSADFPDLRPNACSLPLAFDDVLADLQSKQAWFKEYLASIGEANASVAVFSGSVDDVQSFCAFVQSWLESFSVYVLEQQGILWFEGDLGLKKVDGFSGVVLSDDLAPVVFINEFDEPLRLQAWVQALVCLALGESGVFSVCDGEQRGGLGAWCHQVGRVVCQQLGEQVQFEPPKGSRRFEQAVLTSARNGSLMIREGASLLNWSVDELVEAYRRLG